MQSGTLHAQGGIYEKEINYVLGSCSFLHDDFGGV